jgi:glycosyltransferase involved in cell wall biosynthesis
MCEAVYVERNALRLLLRAEKVLWSRRVALAVAPWTRDGAPMAIRLAPLLVPFFRALFLNARHDFLPGTPGRILNHNWRALRDSMHSGSRRLMDVADGLWRLLSYHIWRSGPCVRVQHLAKAYWRRLQHCALWVVATLLRGFSYPHRRWFHKIHGNATLPVAAEAGDGDEISQFTHCGPIWQHAELEQLVRTSNARWILWHKDGAIETVDDMLPLFDDERTFAVSRQVDYRGWKRQLAIAAPFRALQPGEATRVLAPVSPAVLVDRRKLEALGIPTCSLPGAAWMILFWKAAAAGWRCYSVGQQQALQPQADTPMEETSFLLQMLRDRSLRQLGPAEVPLAGGNIAFEPVRRRQLQAASGRLRVLVVSPFLPFPLSHGGAVRIYNLCRALRGRVDFALAAIREKDEVVDYERLHDVFREVCVVDVDERASTDATLPRQVRHHQSQSLRALIGEMTNSWRPDLLQIEYTHMAGFGDCAPGVPSLLVEHDLTFSLYHQLASAEGTAEAWREFERWRQFEQHHLRSYDAVWAVSEQDRLAAMREAACSGDSTYAIPNGVDTARFRPEPGLEQQEILYVGSFRHLPNLIGFQALRTEVMPRIWAQRPDARLRVVAGPRHHEFWRGETDPRIAVHGFVEDLRPLYARAAAVAVPLAVSAGTNIKVLEAMACGKALVSTPVGCQGLGLHDGRELLVRENWDGFADALVGVLSDTRQRHELGERARRAAQEQFGWDAIAARAWHSYLQVSGRARRAQLLARELAS